MEFACKSETGSRGAGNEEGGDRNVAMSSEGGIRGGETAAESNPLLSVCVLFSLTGAPGRR